MEDNDNTQQKQEEQLSADPSIPPGQDSEQTADSENQEQLTAESKEQANTEQHEQLTADPSIPPGQDSEQTANIQEQTAVDSEQEEQQAQEEQAADPSIQPGMDSGQTGLAGQDEPPTSDGEEQEPIAGDEVASPDPEAATEPAEDMEPSDPGDGSEAVRTALVVIRGQNRTAHFNAGEHSLSPGDEVVIQTEQGKNIGVVMEPPITLSCRGCKNLKILRKASHEEIARDEENRELEKKAFDYCAKTIEEWEIPMRLVQVEFLLDRSKAIFFFTAEKRVDFRELVRTLAREFSTRIEMRQIGIRDEARLIGGVGPCGMAFCCSTFLKEFAPISVKMAKEQNVILNPNKISGGCGRLLCCLNYEYDMYKEASKGVPKVGKKVNLPEGTGKVRSVDIFARTVTIDLPEEKKNIVMDIDELLEKLK